MYTLYYPDKDRDCAGLFVSNLSSSILKCYYLHTGYAGKAGIAPVGICLCVCVSVCLCKNWTTTDEKL